MKMTENNFLEEIIRIVQENAMSDKLDIKAVKEAYTQFKKNEINLSEFERLAKKQIDLAINIERGHSERRMSNLLSNTVHYGFDSFFTHHSNKQAGS